MTAIRVDDVHKSFFTYRSEWGRILSWFGAAPRLRGQTDILKGIKFDIEPGEAVGIVGQNGAGKSTLLKIITGTMQPTKGSVSLNGRVAALLELGMGFNPDMTGRQNVYNSAGLMGFSQEQIDSLIGGIEAFAEIGSYFDQPIRVYSSGMQVRLAFAVATAVRPEILIVDEALSVGDAYFQHKSFNRIREFRTAGTTLLLVSHDRASIISLCNRAILIDSGQVRSDGAPEEVLDLYNALVAQKEGHLLEQTTDEKGRVRTRSGSGEVTIEDVTLLDDEGRPTEMLTVGSEAVLRVVARANQPVGELVAGYMLKDRLGTPIFGTNTYQLGQPLTNVAAGEKVTFKFRFPVNIGYGNYSIAVALHDKDTHISRNYQWQDLAVTFSVVNLRHSEFVGIAWIPPTLEMER
ncbi:ABC transporter ATP-binding protein [Devosia sp. RR2S18]|uniref:ABC transporter ATP-binding protein n=1 Tax=Devosia rhizosphaerae TaxID=3049774 RepID=UPI0025417EA7|nr:ABC transporter ATP-binding protein [Devosia sp. RR2S18]WIJ24020.1 ABC transporter ATP-binding protein [Devosia sp. RR2S18]